MTSTLIWDCPEQVITLRNLRKQKLMSVLDTGREHHINDLNQIWRYQNGTCVLIKLGCMVYWSHKTATGLSEAGVYRIDKNKEDTFPFRVQTCQAEQFDIIQLTTKTGVKNGLDTRLYPDSQPTLKTTLRQSVYPQLGSWAHRFRENRVNWNRQMGLLDPTGCPEIGFLTPDQLSVGENEIKLEAEGMMQVD